MVKRTQAGPPEMIVPDVNLLIYALAPLAIEHGAQLHPSIPILPADRVFTGATR